MDINKLITESLSNIIDENTITDKVKDAAEKAKEIGGEAKNIISENPKASAAVASALAAGLGAVAFRKNLQN